MKIFEVTTFEPDLTEGGDGNIKRYFSEIGTLAAWAGKGDNPSFDPNNVGSWLDASKIENADTVFSDIKKFLTQAYSKEYDRQQSNSKDVNQYGIDGYYSFAKSVREIVLKDLAERKIKEPSKFGWVGGQNKNSVGKTPSDVDFIDHEIGGISVKDDGGIGFGNFGLEDLELKGQGDLFLKYAPDEMMNLKRSVASDFVKELKKNKYIGNEKYNMRYDSGTEKVTIRSEDREQTLKIDDLTSDEFLNNSSPRQRSLGDYYIENKKKYEDLQQQVLVPMAKVLRDAIEQKVFPVAARLSKLGGFGNKPYYYQRPDHVYFVPSVETATEIKIEELSAGEVTGSGIRFDIKLRRSTIPKYATVDAWIRYNKGTWSSSLKFSLQSFKNQENLYWEKLEGVPGAKSFRSNTPIPVEYTDPDQINKSTDQVVKTSTSKPQKPSKPSAPPKPLSEPKKSKKLSTDEINKFKRVLSTNPEFSRAYAGLLDNQRNQISTDPQIVRNIIAAKAQGKTDSEMANAFIPKTIYRESEELNRILQLIQH